MLDYCFFPFWPADSHLDSIKDIRIQMGNNTFDTVMPAGTSLLTEPDFSHCQIQIIVDYD